MKGYNDEQILKGILRHDNLILQYHLQTVLL